MKECMNTFLCQDLVFSTGAVRLITVNVYSMTNMIQAPKKYISVSLATSLKQKATSTGRHKGLWVMPLLRQTLLQSVGRI